MLHHLPPLFQLNVFVFVFLGLLKQIRSLNLELISDYDADNDSVFKWGVNFTPSVDSVTFLYAKSLSEMMMEFQEEEEDETENAITWEELFRRRSLAIECAKAALRWLGILSVVVPHHTMLQNLTISDSMNKGVKFCLVGEKLAECRNTLDLERVVSLAKNLTQENMTVGYVPVLKLPMSGYVMKGVTIINSRLYGDDDSEAGSAMLDAFAEEQGVFSEAMVQILEKHKDGIM